MNAHLIDAVKKAYRLKNDAALSRALKVAPPVVSKWRHETLPVGATGILNLHETFGMDTKEARRLIAIGREVVAA